MTNLQEKPISSSRLPTLTNAEIVAKYKLPLNCQFKLAVESKANHVRRILKANDRVPNVYIAQVTQMYSNDVRTIRSKCSFARQLIAVPRGSVKELVLRHVRANNYNISPFEISEKTGLPPEKVSWCLSRCAKKDPKVANMPRGISKQTILYNRRVARLLGFYMETHKGEDDAILQYQGMDGLKRAIGCEDAGWRVIYNYFKTLQEAGFAMTQGLTPSAVIQRQQRALIAKILSDNPLIDTMSVARMTGVDESVVIGHVEEIHRQLNERDAVRANAYREFVVKEIMTDMIHCDNMMENLKKRNKGQGWMDAKSKKQDMLIKIWGLEKPKDVNVNLGIQKSKEDRDAIVKAFQEASVLREGKERRLIAPYQHDNRSIEDLEDAEEAGFSEE